MHAIRQCLAGLALSLACVSACAKREPESKPSLARASTTPRARPSADEPNALSHTERAEPGCRALAVTGAVSADGAPIVVATLLDGKHWVELARGASVALRHSQTSREFKLIGPGHALPCRNGTEQILLADGQLSTSANLGVRPGAEVLIATPEGVVHYGDAALDLEVGSQGLSVRVKQGEAWVEPERPLEFENPVRSGKELRLRSTLPKAGALVDACQTAAERAEASARRVLGFAGSGGSDSLGVRAALHMRERSAARMACAVAAAAAFNEKDPANRQSLSAAVAHADALWQSVPHAGPSGKN